MTDLGTVAAQGAHLVFDAATGLVVEKALEPSLRKVWEVLKPVLYQFWDPAARSIRLNLQEHIDRETAKDAAYLEKLRKSLKSGEGSALITSMVRTAAQATTEERMEMLAAAAAGLFTPDLDSERRSRVTRAVAALEPSDVQKLRDLDAAQTGPGVKPAVTWSPEFDGLVVAGCVAEQSGVLGVPAVRVTEAGKDVLLTLTTWKPR